MLDELDRRGLASRRLDLGKEAVTAEHDELIRGAPVPGESHLSGNPSGALHGPAEVLNHASFRRHQSISLAASRPAPPAGTLMS